MKRNVRLVRRNPVAAGPLGVPDVEDGARGLHLKMADAHDDDAPTPFLATEVPVAREDLGVHCDIQGIDWPAFTPTTRTSFRAQRIANYNNYRNCSADHALIVKDLHRGYTECQFYDFQYTLTRHKFVRPTPPANAILTQSHPLVYAQVLRREAFRVSTVCASREYVFMGAFTGECVLKVCAAADGDSNVETIRTGIATTDPFGITNHVEIGESRTGEHIALVSSNDDAVRIMRLADMKVSQTFKFPWAANCSSVSPDKRLICVTGDNTDSVIISADTGDAAMKLTGHIDFSFSCAWSPCGRFIATGNQDLTTRVYDIRNAAKALVVLPSIMGAVRSLRFSDDGMFLAAAEPCDFVHVYDFSGGAADYLYHTRENAGPAAAAERVPSPLGTTAFESQVVDFFGEISGISFTPDGGSILYVGVSDDMYGSILEFGRRKSPQQLFLEDVVL
ncbi:hypothetical protein HDU84_003400 [Entophlyctis sp. JEL0112]|nr:hypothetical protein HDU84_003400 [Entophlyctis sp. JEL0112]